MENRIVSIHQPNFLPWLGYFHKIAHSQVFVILDNVEFSKGSFTNRNKIKLNNGKESWLTVPVHFSKSLRQQINQVSIPADTNWREKHISTFSAHYGRAEYFRSTIEIVTEAFSKDHQVISDLNADLIDRILSWLGIKTEILSASHLDLETDLRNNELLIRICKEVGASVYLSGVGAKDYLDVGLFSKNGITVEFQKFTHPCYPQLHGEFIPNLSVIDALFNLGGQGTRDFLD